MSNFEFVLYGNMPNLIERLSKLDSTIRHKIVVSEWKAKRSNEQNKWIWKFATDLGKHLGYTADEMYDLINYKFNPKFVTDKTTGEQIRLQGSFSKLKTDEAAEIQSQVLIWAESLGFYFEG